MLIKINSDDTTSEDEWCILEFQGELLGDMHCGANVGELIEIKVRLLFILEDNCWYSNMQGNDVKMVIGQVVVSNAHNICNNQRCAIKAFIRW